MIIDCFRKWLDLTSLVHIGPENSLLGPPQQSGPEMAPRAAIPKRDSVGPPFPRDSANRAGPDEDRRISMIQIRQEFKTCILMRQSRPPLPGWSLTAAT